MALPTSGALSLNAIHVEAGGASGTQASLNDADIRNLISKGSGVQMSFNEWYGASAGSPNQATGNLIYAPPPVGDKYNSQTWIMTSFSDATVGGKTLAKIYVGVSTIITAGLIEISGSHATGTNARASQVLGYNKLKIGSTQILDLTSGSGGIYSSAGNFTQYSLITYSTNSLSETTQNNLTFTFTA